MEFERAVIWAGAICTLAMYSILYRENKIYRLFEHLFIGLATGYGVVVVWRDILEPRWWGPLSEEGKWYWAFALPLGGLYYLIYSRKYVWLSRLIISSMFGLSAGYAFKGFVLDQVPQFYAAYTRPLLTQGYPNFSNLVALITLISVLSYFFFSFRRERVPGLERVAMLGRWLMMISFGAIFGSTVMARMSLLIARLQYLLFDWLGL